MPVDLGLSTVPEAVAGRVQLEEIPAVLVVVLAVRASPAQSPALLSHTAAAAAVLEQPAGPAGRLVLVVLVVAATVASAGLTRRLEAQIQAAVAADATRRKPLATAAAV
jgi:hypothetical protein